MRIHKEGRKILFNMAIGLAILNLLIKWLLPEALPFVAVTSILSFGLVLQFFRNPTREILLPDDNLIYAPADGKIVAIEKTDENEYFGDQRLQVSIFMSPTNVHVNRNPVGGKVKLFQIPSG